MVSSDYFWDMVMWCYGKADFPSNPGPLPKKWRCGNYRRYSSPSASWHLFCDWPSSSRKSRISGIRYGMNPGIEGVRSSGYKVGERRAVEAMDLSRLIGGDFSVWDMQLKAPLLQPPAKEPLKHRLDFISSENVHRIWLDSWKATESNKLRRFPMGENSRFTPF